MSEKKYPDAVKYMPLIVQALVAIGGSAKASAVREKVEEIIIKSGEVVPDAILPSGPSKFANDLQWARMYLVKSGWLETKDASGYGVWKLSGYGWSSRLDEATAKQAYDSIKSSQSNQQEPRDDVTYEQMQIAETVDYQKQLADILTTMEAGQFETLCMQIMAQSGFEAHKITPHHNQPDGGIDGEGMLSLGGSLVKIKIAWQCKRFKEKLVGAKVVRDFRGSIDGKTQYGIIFTSSSFTAEATTEAKRPGATPIELFGLEQMIRLLVEKQIGVTPIQTYEVNKEYFRSLKQYQVSDLLSQP